MIQCTCKERLLHLKGGVKMKTALVILGVLFVLSGQLLLALVCLGFILFLSAKEEEGKGS